MKSLSTTRSNQMLALLAVAQLMGVLDFSIVNIALAVGGNPSVAATTGYQAALYLALVLAVIADVLAVLLMRTRTPVATHTRTPAHEQQRAGATR
jgi:hypothetical protein